MKLRFFKKDDEINVEIEDCENKKFSYHLLVKSMIDKEKIETKIEENITNEESAAISGLIDEINMLIEEDDSEKSC